MVTNPMVPFIIGAIVGMVLASIIYLTCNTVGTLRIDHTSSEKDISRIEIDELDSLNDKSRIVLKIDHDADLSHK